MWIIMPLIYVMSWRSCRRFGQAFSETAAWVVGYLIATGILLALHFGGVGMISATPDDPASVVAIIGGFAGMGVSRYLWKRRGGHLEPVKNPLVDNRWFRAARAMVVPTKSKTKRKAAPRPRAAVRPNTVSAPSTRSSDPKQAAATSNRSSAPKSAAASSSNHASGSKSSAQRWGRVLGAMISPPDSQRRPPR